MNKPLIRTALGILAVAILAPLGIEMQQEYMAIKAIRIEVTKRHAADAIAAAKAAEFQKMLHEAWEEAQAREATRAAEAAKAAEEAENTRILKGINDKTAADAAAKEAAFLKSAIDDLAAIEARTDAEIKTSSESNR